MTYAAVMNPSKDHHHASSSSKQLSSLSLLSSMKNSKSSSNRRLNIKIKPFLNPPRPPANLYERNISVLKEATNAILRKEPLLVSSSSSSSSDGNNDSAMMSSQQNMVPISREELYRSVEDLCVHGYAHRLYEDVCKFLEEGAIFCLSALCSEGNKTTLCTSINGNNAISFHHLGKDQIDQPKASYILEQVVRKVYYEYLEYLRFVRNIFLYLDRTFVLNRVRKVRSLWDAGIDIFRRYADLSAEASSSTPGAVSMNVIQATITSILHLLKVERDEMTHVGNTTATAAFNRSLVRESMRMLADLPQGVFTNKFLPQFLSDTVQYFDFEGKAKMMQTSSKISASEFLVHVEKRWVQANDMTKEYLNFSRMAQHNFISSSSPNNNSEGNVSNSMSNLLASAVETHLLLPHVDSFLLKDEQIYPLFEKVVCDDNGIHSNDRSNIRDLNRLYFLLKKVNKLDELRSAFGRYGRYCGTLLITERDSNAETVISNLLRWKDRLERIYQLGFLNDESFGYSMISQSNQGSASSSSNAESNTSTMTNTSNSSNSNTNTSYANMHTTSCLRGVLEDVLNGCTIPMTNSLSSSFNNINEKSFEKHGRRVSELLAKYVDLCLRSSKKISAATAAAASSTTSSSKSSLFDSTDPEHLLEKIMSLFRFLQSKDVFEAFYKRDLAKRLLSNKSSSSSLLLSLERSFISKLKSECGTAYTSKMEGMFKDMDLSQAVMQNYQVASQQQQENKSNTRVEMDVQILTTGYWPIYTQIKTYKLLDELIPPLTNFEEYYKNKYQKRRIVWQHSLGSCVVKAFFPSSAGAKDLVLSQYQTSVLVGCFNHHDESSEGLTMDQIIQKTGIEDQKECGRILQSLTDPPSGPGGPTPVGVLIKKDNGVNIKPTYHINTHFQSKQYRIKLINQILSLSDRSSSSAAELLEDEKIHESINRDRLYLIDAAIVRIMKSRKSLLHNELIGQTMDQLKFPTTAENLKKRIESLMERDYIQRSETDRNRYNYLA